MPELSSVVTFQKKRVPLGEPSDLEIVETQKSLARCFKASGFLDRFFEHFWASHPQVAPCFVDTDKEQLKERLYDDLGYLIMYARMPFLGQYVIDQLKERHGRGQLNIHPLLYQYWVDAFIKTVAEMDNNSAELELAWRKVLAPAVDAMASGY